MWNSCSSEVVVDSLVKNLLSVAVDGVLPNTLKTQQYLRIGLVFNFSDKSVKVGIRSTCIAINALINGAPGTLDTLKELADAVNSNKSLVDALNEGITNKQDTLVSGTNIKTINGVSILGTGNITISRATTAGTADYFKYGRGVIL